MLKNMEHVVLKTQNFPKQLWITESDIVARNDLSISDLLNEVYQEDLL
jgi:hypothetical protein